MGFILINGQPVHTSFLRDAVEAQHETELTMNTDLIEKLEAHAECLDAEPWPEFASLLRTTITALQQAQESQEARRTQETSEVPCCLCGGPVIEFTVPSVHWNRIVRKNRPETDKEYLCWECFERKLIAEALKQAQEDTRRLDHWARFIRSAIGSQTIARHIECEIHLGRDVREVLDEADRCNTATTCSTTPAREEGEG